MEKDRELRYQSAAEMRTDLQRLKRDIEIGRPAGVSSGQAKRRTAIVSLFDSILGFGVCLGLVLQVVWLSLPPLVSAMP
jgi:hypothetical protein